MENNIVKFDIKEEEVLLKRGALFKVGNFLLSLSIALDHEEEMHDIFQDTCLAYPCSILSLKFPIVSKLRLNS